MSSRGGEASLKVRAIRLRNDSSLFLSVDTTDGSRPRQLGASKKVGKEVRVYSPVDRKWHAAAIVDCQEGQGVLYHKIVYSDGKVSWIDLKAEKVLIGDDGNLNATMANPGVNKLAQTRKSRASDAAHERQHDYP